MEFFICLINAWKELFLLGENKSYAMVSTVIIEYRFIYGSSAEIERYTFTIFSGGTVSPAKIP
jgi:hypothetical protein